MLVAIAMGVQNTTLRMAGILTVYTTHVTGTMTKFAEDAIDWLFRPRDGAAEAGDRARAGAALFSSGL